MERSQLGHQNYRNINKMKKLFCLILFGLFCNVASATPVMVTRIVDGDTFKATVLLADGIEVMSVGVRLRNVDTPELHGECDYTTSVRFTSTPSTVTSHGVSQSPTWVAR